MYLDRFLLCHRPKRMSATKPAMNSACIGSKFVCKYVALNTAIETQKTMRAFRRFRKKSLAPSLARRSARSQYKITKNATTKIIQSRFGAPVR